MKTLWLNLSGTEQSRKRMGLEKLDYPLCYNLPRSAWIIEKTSISLLSHSILPSIYIDLLVELNRDLCKVDETYAKSAIGGFRWCVGVSDQWFIEQVDLPTLRDQSTCIYYSRWPDGYNVTGPLMKLECNDIHQSTFECRIGKENISLTVEFDIEPSKVISFLSGLTTIGIGDLISLGSLVAGKPIENFPENISLNQEGFYWSIKIDKMGSVT